MTIILGTKFADPVDVGYSKEQLQTDLASGVGSIIAGVGSDYRLDVNSSAAAIVISHKDAVFKGVAAAGSNKPAIGITSAGIAMGFNQASDGAWIDAVAITSAGVASFAGNVNASGGNIVGTMNVGGAIVIGSSGSLYTVGKPTYASTAAGIWMGYDSGSYKLNIGSTSGSSLKWDGSNLYINGTTASTVVSGAAAGALALPAANFDGTLQAKLTSGVTNVLAGTGSNYRLNVDSANAVIMIGHKDAVYNASAGAGGIRPAIAISANGIAMGYNNTTGLWSNAVSISSTGTAIFNGTVYAEAGSFGGTIAASAVIVAEISANKISAGTITASVSIQSGGYIVSRPNTYYSTYNAALWAEPLVSGMYGVVGICNGQQAGVYGDSKSAAGYGLYGANSAGGTALYVDGKSTYQGAATYFSQASYSDGLKLDHGTTTSLSLDTTSAGLSAHATHNLSASFYKSGSVPVATTAPYLYFWNAGKVVGYINGVGSYGTA